MTERSILYRKLAYAIVMMGLLFPLWRLGAPLSLEAGPEGDMVVKEGGGALADFRHDNNLSQANLGEIDPASETLKLATLGLRGVAVNLLWGKANEFKMKEDWGNLTATLEQLAKLQPNYVTFWKYQSWNVSYNVSVEFDDYRDRYYYVREGIEFLKRGERYNRDNPHILWELGWFVGQKIGKADEKVQYRRLFKNDEDFHPEDRPKEQRDNWLVGKQWYRKSEQAAETRGIGRKSPVVFYSSAPKNQMNYAAAIEDEGRFDPALPAWRLAGEEWNDFGNLTVEHSTGVLLKLNDEQRLTKLEEQTRKELMDLAPEITGPFVKKRYAELPPEAQAAYEMAPEDRDPAQQALARQAEFAMKPAPQEIADLILAGAKENKDLSADQKEALDTLVRRKLGELNDVIDRRRKTQNYKQTANFEYWKLRCEFEQTDNAINARKLCHQGYLAMEQDADPVRAAELYAQGMERWKAVLDAYPSLRDGEDTTGDDIMVFIIQYNDVLMKNDQELPADFPLWDIIETFDVDGVFTEELANHQRRVAEKEGKATPEGEQPGGSDSAATSPTAPSPAGPEDAGATPDADPDSAENPAEQPEEEAAVGEP